VNLAGQRSAARAWVLGLLGVWLVAAAPAAEMPTYGPYAALPKGLYTVERQGQGVFYHKGVLGKLGVHVIDADLSDP